jgi:hypothetical protein
MMVVNSATVWYIFNDMPAKSKITKIQEDEKEKDALVFTFTNGAKEQLEELRAFLKTETELDVLKTGIALLVKYKKEKEKETNDANK